MAEISDAALQQLQALAGGFSALYQDPKFGMPFKRLLKEWKPDMAIPEIDAAEPHVKTLKDFRDELTALKADLATKEIESALDSKLAQARTRYQLTDEGLEAVKKAMLEHRIEDPLVAAELLDGRARKERQTTRPAPRPQRIGPDIEKEREKEKALYADPDAWARQELLDGMRAIEERARAMEEA